MSPAERRPRRGWRAVALVLACGWAADRFALPALAGYSLHRALASSGYPDARFAIERVGIDRVRLRDVRLAAGLDLGEVELDVGLSALWGHRPERATIRGARIALDELELYRRGGPPAPPVRRLRVERAELTRGGDRVTVTGDVSLAGPLAVDLRATGARLGGLGVGDLALRVREAGGGRYDAAWELGGASWTARGAGALLWRDGAPATVRAHAELRARELRAGGTSLEGARIALDLDGPLAALDVRGEAYAERAELTSPAATLTLRDLRVPLAARADYTGGTLAVRGRPVVGQIGEAMLAAAGRRVRAAGLAIELGGAAGGSGAAGGGERTGERTLIALGRDPAWPVRVQWRAETLDDGTLRAEQLTGSYDLAARTHAIAWRSLAAPSLELGRGELALRLDDGRVRLERARLELAGGELVAAPATIALAGADPARAPARDPARAAETELTVAARGLRLGRLLPGRAVEATAVLDGEVALRLAGSGVTFVRGELHARGRGTLRITDPELRARALAMTGLELPLVGALAELEHTTLAAVLGPPGSEPELRVTARARGIRVPQELELAINFRGVWTALDRLARSYR